MNEDAEFKICSLLELLTKYWQQKKKNFIYIKKLIFVFMQADMYLPPMQATL